MIRKGLAAAVLASAVLAAGLAALLFGCGDRSQSVVPLEDRPGQKEPIETLDEGFAYVRDVLAGDMLEIQDGERIHFADVDVPHEDEPGAEAARNYVVQRALGKKVLIRRLGTGRYAQTVGLVWAEPLKDEHGQHGAPLTLGQELTDRGLGRVREVGRYVWGTSTGLPPTAAPEFRAKRDDWWDRHRPLQMIWRKPVAGYAMPRATREPDEKDPTRWP